MLNQSRSPTHGNVLVLLVNHGPLGALTLGNAKVISVKCYEVAPIVRIVYRPVFAERPLEIVIRTARARLGQDVAAVTNAQARIDVPNVIPAFNFICGTHRIQGDYRIIRGPKKTRLGVLNFEGRHICLAWKKNELCAREGQTHESNEYGKNGRPLDSPLQ